MGVAARFSGPGQPYEGLAKKVNGKPAWTNKVVFVEKHLEDPLHWKKPRMIFVNSMSDLFHEDVQDEWLDKIFTVMALARQHTFQVLTKRPQRMRKYCQQISQETGVVLDNVWLGTSVENQDAADDRIPCLLETPAAVRFLSCEPLLGPVDLSCVPLPTAAGHVYLDATTGSVFANRGDRHRRTPWQYPRLDWVIDGGESGPYYRPANPDWYRSLRDQCVAAGVAYWHKQDSGPRSGTGTLLDGVEWHQFPKAAA
jgi:protein gp37